MNPHLLPDNNRWLKAMLPYEGQILETKQIAMIIIRSFPELQVVQDRLYPLGHCLNHFNKGSCYCAESKKAIFRQVERGIADSSWLIFMIANT